jgi:hypothetical protein
VKYGFEWTPGLVLLGAVVVLPLAPAFAMIGLLIVAIAAVAALIALAASPFLLVHHVRRRLEERDRPADSPAPLATTIATAALAGPATARSSQ